MSRASSARFLQPHLDPPGAKHTSAMEVQRDFARKPVQVELSGHAAETARSQTINIEDLVKIAEEALRVVVRKGLSGDNPAHNAKLDALYKEMWNDYKDFVRDYPVIFRWIVFRQIFEKKAFHAYIKNYHKSVFQNRKEMVVAQVQYIVMCRRIKYRTESAKELQGFAQFITKKLVEEDELFQKAGEEAEKEHKENEKQRELRARADLQAALAAAKGSA
jgi:hypothetical protein